MEPFDPITDQNDLFIHGVLKNVLLGVAIVSGASRGIGRAVAEKLARQGLAVALVARNGDEVALVAQGITDLGGVARPFVIDLCHEPDTQRVIEQVREEFGRVDFLINSAGLGQFKSVEAFSSLDWDSVMDINVKSTFLLCKAVLPLMKEKRKGHIISISSDVARRTFPTGSLYCSAKAAQDVFLASLRKEVRPFGIKVSTVYPGLVDSKPDPLRSDRLDWLTPDDVAGAVQYVLNTPPHEVIDELMLHPQSQEY